jgi:hypothetical protein
MKGRNTAHKIISKTIAQQQQLLSIFITFAAAYEIKRRKIQATYFVKREMRVKKVHY